MGAVLANQFGSGKLFWKDFSGPGAVPGGGRQESIREMWFKRNRFSHQTKNLWNNDVMRFAERLGFSLGDGLRCRVAIEHRDDPQIIL